ncbi:MAG: LCP family protein [Acidimicrobiia bacterium]
MWWRHLHPAGLAVILLVGSALGVLAWTATRTWAAFEEVAVEEFAPEQASAALAGRPDSEVAGITLSQEERAALIAAIEAEAGAAAAEAEALTVVRELAGAGESSDRLVHPHAFAPRLPDDMFDAFLLIGADASGALADVIILVLAPTDGATPMMVSLPRDLYLPNQCTRTWNRINTNLGGCRGYATGPELLALAVQEFTGVTVDHYARIGFSGFAGLVDAFGGYTVCVPAPTRDANAQLDLPAGCTRADGATTLAWVRSRNTERLVGEEWRRVVSSDFARQARQQDVLLELASRMLSARSPASLTRRFENVAPYMRLDDGWTIREAASYAWRYRRLDLDEVIRLEVPVRNRRAPTGAAVLVPIRGFNDVLVEAYRPAAR